MRTLNGLIWRNLMQRKLRTGLSVAGVALGVALVFASLSVAIAASADASKQTDWVNLQIISSSGTFVEAALADKARLVPNIAAVSPRLTLAAISAANTSATLTLHGVEPDSDAKLHTREIIQGAPLSADGQIVVPSDWAAKLNIGVGGSVTLFVVSGGNQFPRPLIGKIVGLLHPAGGGQLAPDAFVTLPTLQQVAGAAGKVSLLEVRYVDGADGEKIMTALRDALDPSVSLVPQSTFTGNVLFNFIINVVLAMAGFGILLTAAYLIFNTFAMTLAERRVDMGRLIALGMTPQQASRSILVEAALLGSVGSIAGLILGALLTIPLHLTTQLLLDSGSQSPPTISLSVIGAVVGVIMGLAITLIAALPIARQAGRIGPLEMIFAQRSGKAPRFRGITLAGIVIVALGALLIVSVVVFGLGGSLSPFTSFGQMIMLFGALLVVPELLTVWFRFLRRRVGLRLGLTGSLALSNLEQQPTRSALAASALTVVTASTVMMAGLIGSISQSQSGAIQGFLTADYLLTPGGSGNALMAAASGKLAIPTDPGFRASLDALKSKVIVTRMALLEAPELAVIPVFPAGIAYDMTEFLRQSNRTFVGASIDEIRAAFAAGPALILSQPIADRMHVKVGDTISLKTPRGPVGFKIAAIEDRIFYTYADYKQIEQFYNSVMQFMIGIQRQTGVSAAEIEPDLKKLADQNGLSLISTAQLIDGQTAFFGSLGAIFAALGILTMVVAALGILGTMYTSVMERRRELGILSAVGGTPGQLRRVVLLESALIGISGAVPGVVIGLAIGLLTGPLSVMQDKANNMHMFAGDVVIPWIPLVASLIGAPLVAAAAAWLPARQVVKLQVVEALRYQ